MLFTSIPFLIFLVVVVFGYYQLKAHRWQNLWLLAASYYFYGFFAWEFSALIGFSTLVNYSCGRGMGKAKDKRRKSFYLWLSVTINLGVLGFFKYFNFFADNLTEFLALFGADVSWHITGLMVPIGISFYTFQALSYTIDIYRGSLKPVDSFWDFALFVAFFPQLVAGPIERASKLLPQITKPRSNTADNFLSGLWLIALGCYKKIFVADQLGRFVTVLLAPAETYAGGDVALGCVLFSLQIYADFSGYTDVARGTAKLFGFELMKNFKAPYLATNLQDFWNRWHLSLTTWIKDYMFYPMAVSRRWNKILGAGGISIVIMVVIGFWHGASWNFVLWGAFHGIAIHIYMKLRPFLYRNYTFENFFVKRIWFVASVLLTFSLVSISEILFCNDSMTQAWWMLRDMVSNPVCSANCADIAVSTLWIWIVPFLLDVEEYRSGKGLAPLATWHPVVRLAIQTAMVTSIAQLYLAEGFIEITPYVYFQF